MMKKRYKAIISSDWNQCLAPCGPFDPIMYNYPDLTSDLTAIFKKYTGNIISLGSAIERINTLIPKAISVKQMDDYLENTFTTYKGVPELIDWCEKNNILFMINTTGMLGYFQRIFAKELLPTIPVISANSMIRYPHMANDPSQIYDLHEIQDKGKNTSRAMKYFGIPENKIVMMGDSGGDGPHFEWGKRQMAYMIGSMAKSSLLEYCNKRNIKINHYIGPTYAKDEERIESNEMGIDFLELSSVLEKVLK